MIQLIANFQTRPSCVTGPLLLLLLLPSVCKPKGIGKALPWTAAALLQGVKGAEGAEGAFVRAPQRENSRSRRPLKGRSSTAAQPH